MERHIAITATWIQAGQDFRQANLLVAWLRAQLGKLVVVFKDQIDPQMEPDRSAYRCARLDQFFRANGMLTASQRLDFLELVRKYNMARECGGPDGFDDYIVHLTFRANLQDGPPPAPHQPASSHEHANKETEHPRD